MKTFSVRVFCFQLRRVSNDDDGEEGKIPALLLVDAFRPMIIEWRYGLLFVVFDLWTNFCTKKEKRKS